MNLRKEILAKTLNEMPKTFSGARFTQLAVLNGLTEKERHNHSCSNYLHEHAKKHPFNTRSWVKVDKKEAYESVHKTEALSKERTGEYIAFLKQLGYKILKPTTEFKEV